MKYEKPECEIIELKRLDVITVSPGTDDNDDNIDDDDFG